MEQVTVFVLRTLLRSSSQALTILKFSSFLGAWEILICTHLCFPIDVKSFLLTGVSSCVGFCEKWLSAKHQTSFFSVCKKGWLICSFFSWSVLCPVDWFSIDYHCSGLGRCSWKMLVDEGNLNVIIWHVNFRFYNKLQENLGHRSEKWYNVLQKVLKVSAAVKTVRLSTQNTCWVLSFA